MKTITDMKTYANGNGKHAYDVEAKKDETRVIFLVYATNRDQASRRVERDGYQVCSVNMVG